MRPATCAIMRVCLMFATTFLSCNVLLGQQTNAISLGLVSKPVGVVALNIPANSEAMLSVPFDPFDPSLSALLDGQLTAATDSSKGDLVRFWDAVSSRYGTYEKVSSNEWHMVHATDDATNASASVEAAASIEMGKGFIVANRQPFPQRVMFGGAMALDNARAVKLPGGVSLVAYPFSSAMPVGETSMSKAGGSLTGNSFEMATGYWHALTNGAETTWNETRPYPNPFPEKGEIQVAELSCDAGKCEATLGIAVSGISARKVDVFKRDMAPSDRVGDWRGWTLLAADLWVEPGKPFAWTDRTLATDPAFKGVRLYVAACADVDLNGDGIPDAREWLCGTGTDTTDNAGAADSGVVGVNVPVREDGTVTGSTPENAGTSVPAKPALWRDLIHVDARRGSDTFSGLLSTVGANDGPKRTIKAALDAVPAGGTVLVNSGTYSEDLRISGKPVNVKIRGKVTLRLGPSRDN